MMSRGFELPVAKGISGYKIRSSHFTVCKFKYGKEIL
jgi:hypothetical protein